jgi:hypothetical protein
VPPFVNEAARKGERIDQRMAGEDDLVGYGSGRCVDLADLLPIDKPGPSECGVEQGRISAGRAALDDVILL